MDRTPASLSPRIFISTICVVLTWLYITGLNLSQKDEVLGLLQAKGGHLSVPLWINSLVWYITTAFWSVAILYFISCTVRTVTNFRSKSCYIHEMGHVHWAVYATASASLVGQHYWQHFTKLPDLWAATLAIAAATTFMMAALFTQIYHLENNVVALWRESLELDIKVMYYVVIQAIDLYATWLLYLMLITLDAYLVSVGVHQGNSNILLVLLTMFILICYPLLDVMVFDRWLHYLVAGYICLSTGILGTLMYQMDEAKPSITSILAAVLVISGVLFKLHNFTNTRTKSGFKLYTK